MGNLRLTYDDTVLLSFVRKCTQVIASFSMLSTIILLDMLLGRDKKGTLRQWCNVIYDRFTADLFDYDPMSGRLSVLPAERGGVSLGWSRYTYHPSGGKLVTHPYLFLGVVCTQGNVFGLRVESICTVWVIVCFTHLLCTRIGQRILYFPEFIPRLITSWKQSVGRKYCWELNWILQSLVLCFDKLTPFCSD